MKPENGEPLELPNLVDDINKFSKDWIRNYQKLKPLLEELVGKTIVFRKGKNQMVGANVISKCPHSLRIEVKNVDTEREYFIGIETIRLKRIIDFSKSKVIVKNT